MKDANLNGTGISNQDSQVNNSNLKNQIDLKSMTNEELIDLLKENNYSTGKIGTSFGKSEMYARRIYKKRGIDYNKLAKENKNSQKEEYYKNPNFCQHCGKELDWEHRNNKYCSKSCSASENNKGSSKNPFGINSIKTKFDPKLTLKEKKERVQAKSHNLMIKTKYQDLNIPLLLPGQCVICGCYNCNNKFCKKHNFQQLISMVKHLNFNPETIGTVEVIKEFERVRQIVYNLYWIDNKSGVELEEMFGYGKYTIYDVLRYLEIPIRNQSDALKNSLLTGRSNPIKVLSINNLNINQSRHITWNGTDVFLRSSYELDYALELDKLKINYLVEGLRIEYYDSVLNKNRVAIPDFYLPDTNEIVEIKSDFTLDIQEMVNKFNTYKKLGYIPKLILEHEEIDIYNIDNLINKDRLDRIKTKNIKHIILKP